MCDSSEINDIQAVNMILFILIIICDSSEINTIQAY